jgi:hypothetical protein
MSVHVDASIFDAYSMKIPGFAPSILSMKSNPGFYPDLFQDILPGREEIPEFEGERHEFEMDIWFRFIHDCFLLRLSL